MPGLRFFRVGGWVAEIGSRIGGCAHPLEKSAANLKNASIHGLSSWQYILRSELPLFFGHSAKFAVASVRLLAPQSSLTTATGLHFGPDRRYVAS
jgi:hypothetical protein